MDQAPASRYSQPRAWTGTSQQHCKPATTRRGPSPMSKLLSATRPQQQHNQGKRQRLGRLQPRIFYCVFHGEDSGHPTMNCVETKVTKDRMPRAAPADNQRSIAHTYQPHPYHHHHYQNKHPYYPQHQKTTIQSSPANMPAAPR
jgi:hypothetical protein